MIEPVSGPKPKQPRLPGEPRVTRYRTWYCLACYEEFENTSEIRLHLKRRHKVADLFGAKEKTSHKRYGLNGHTETWAWHVGGVNLEESVVVFMFND